jgi:hypothetical protein
MRKNKYQRRQSYNGILIEKTQIKKVSFSHSQQRRLEYKPCRKRIIQKDSHEDTHSQRLPLITPFIHGWVVN